MRIEALQELLELQGAGLSGEELSYVGEWYGRCSGTDHWDVREYARPTGIGAREYRVIRGLGGQDVYRSGDRDRATAVRTALNELESLERPRTPLSGGG